LPTYTRRDPGRTAKSAADAEGHLFAFTLAELRGLVAVAGFVIRFAGYEGSAVMADRLWVNRVLPPAGLMRLSRLLNRLPGARWLSYTCHVCATKPPA
jgi:hypothetical protein